MHRFLDGCDARGAPGAAYSQRCSTAVLPGVPRWAPAACLPAALSPAAPCCQMQVCVEGRLLRLGTDLVLSSCSQPLVVSSRSAGLWSTRAERAVCCNPGVPLAAVQLVAEAVHHQH